MDVYYVVYCVKIDGKYNKTFLQCFVMLFDAILELLQTIIANASIITEMIRSWSEVDLFTDTKYEWRGP